MASEVIPWHLADRTRNDPGFISSMSGQIEFRMVLSARHIKVFHVSASLGVMLKAIPLIYMVKSHWVASLTSSKYSGGNIQHFACIINSIFCGYTTSRSLEYIFLLLCFFPELNHVALKNNNNNKPLQGIAEARQAHGINFTLGVNSTSVWLYLTQKITHS